MSFNVGEIVSTLRLDMKGWNKSIKKVKKDVKKLRKFLIKNGMDDININLDINVKAGGKQRKKTLRDLMNLPVK